MVQFEKIAIGDTAAGHAFGSNTGEVGEIDISIKDFQDSNYYTQIEFGYVAYTANPSQRRAEGGATWKNISRIDTITLLVETVSSPTYSAEITVMGIPHA